MTAFVTHPTRICGIATSLMCRSHDQREEWKYSQRPCSIVANKALLPYTMDSSTRLPGKPAGISGGDVEKYYRDGRFARSPNIAKGTSSTPTGCGCVMNDFAAR